jgi:hypothetical protein
MPHNSAESYQLSPTKAEVDAYIGRLESEVSQRDARIPTHQVENRGAAARPAPYSNSRSLFWGLIALVLGCFAWLIQAITRGF